MRVPMGTPKSSMFCCDLPFPSSCWSTHIYGNHHLVDGFFNQWLPVEPLFFQEHGARSLATGVVPKLLQLPDCSDKLGHFFKLPRCLVEFPPTFRKNQMICIYYIYLCIFDQPRSLYLLVLFLPFSFGRSPFFSADVLLISLNSRTHL